MKANKRFLVAVVAVLTAGLAVLLLIGMANAQKAPPGDAAKSPPDPKPSREYQWSALDNVDRFTQTLEAANFSVYEAQFAYVDLVDLNCQNKLITSLANNPWPNAYLVITNSQILEKTANEDDPLLSRVFDNFPFFWQLGEDEAWVMVGQTPPDARYFSFATTALLVRGDPGSPTPWKIVGANVGDNTNNLTIRTIGPDPFEAPIVYIITGNRETERRVRAAARAAGYPDAIINVETISPKLAPLGIGPGGSTFFTAARAAAAKDDAELRAYITDPPMKVFRLTPKAPLPPAPEPVPILRVKGTGHTEMELWPAAQKLREAILRTYANEQHYDFKELDTRIWTLDTPTIWPSSHGPTLSCEKPYVVLQRGVFMGGGNRDTNYLATYPNFKFLPGADDFVILYGVNHQTTGKASYSSFSLYADAKRWLGVGTKTSPHFDEDGGNPGNAGDSARYYLCPDDPKQCDPDVQYLYAWKIARHCDDGEPFCMETAVENTVFSRPDDSTYTCQANAEHPDFIKEDSELFFLFRSYLEPATKVGPDDNELVYDRAIYFGPYFVMPG